MKIAVVGGNDFALANAYFLSSRQHDVTWICENEENVTEFENGTLITSDESIRAIYDSTRLPLLACASCDYSKFDLIVLAQSYRIFSEGLVLLDKTLNEISICCEGSLPTIVLRSPLTPFKEYPDFNLVYIPQFEQSNQWFYDMVHCNNVVLGGHSALVEVVARAFEFPSIVSLTLTEAILYKTASDLREAATQVYLNEVESLAHIFGLPAGNIIEALQHSLPRKYTNPNFGYGDRLHQVAEAYAKQNLLPMFASLSSSNSVRLTNIARRILTQGAKKIYFYEVTDEDGQTYDGAMMNLVQEVSNQCNSHPHRVNLIVYDQSLTAMPDWFKGLHIRDLDLGSLDSDSLIVVATGNAVTDYAASMGIKVLTCEYKVY